MAFWQEFARSRLSPSAFAEASRRQREYDRAMETDQSGGGPGVFGLFFINIRASRWGRQYWNESRMIDQVMSQHRANDLGHPPGCTCRFCFRGFVNQGFGP